MGSQPLNLQNTGGTRHGCRNGAKPGCKRHNAGAKGRDAGSRSRIKPLAPMGTCIGANGWILLQRPGWRLACSRFPSHPMAYSRVRNAAEIHVYSSEILTHHVRLSEE